MPIPKALTDGRRRFREIYHAVRADHGHALPDDRPTDQALTRLPDEPPPLPDGGAPVYLGPERLPLHVAIVPGLIADCVDSLLAPFRFAQVHLEQHGFRATLVPVSGRRGSRHNAGQIRAALPGLFDGGDDGEQLVLVGYSKGINDVLQAIVEFPEVRQRTAAVVSLAGAVGGSALAERVPRWLAWLLDKLPLPGCAGGDGAAIHDLRPDVRQTWLKRHSLPPEIHYFSLVAAPTQQRVSRILRPSYRRLAREDACNDGQVIHDDAIIPGSTLLAYANADHWAITLPIARQWPRLAALAVDQNAYPREVLLEAVARYIEETLLQQQESINVNKSVNFTDSV